MQQIVSFAGFTALAQKPVATRAGGQEVTPGLFAQVLQGVMQGTGTAEDQILALPVTASGPAAAQPAPPAELPPSRAAELPVLLLASPGPNLAVPLETQVPGQGQQAELVTPLRVATAAVLGAAEPTAAKIPAPRLKPADPESPVPEAIAAAVAVAMTQPPQAAFGPLGPLPTPQPFPAHAGPPLPSVAHPAPDPIPSDSAAARFIQQAVRWHATDGVQPRTDDQVPAQAPSQDGAQPGPVPTFSDLVELVAGAEPRQSGGPELPLRDSNHEGFLPEPVTSPEEPELPQTTEFRAPQLQAEPPTQSQETQESRRPPVDPEAVVRQVAKSVKVFLDGKRSEVQLQLNPEHLGKVAVRLILHEGSVQASISARDASVRAALESGIEQLKLRFAEQGLKVEHVHVSVGGDSGYGQSQQSHGDHPRQQGQPAGRQHYLQGRLDAEQGQQEPDNRKASPRMWGYGHPGSRINSLA